MLAILSDIHGNLEALQAVLDDAQAMKAESIVFLGDLVGYGPDPCACIELAMSWQTVLRGSFDDALVWPDRSAEWIDHLVQMMQRLRKRVLAHPIGNQMLDFLANCPTSHKTSDALFVHGSPRDHLNEYVFPEDVFAIDKMSAIFAGFEKICFCGRSHIPGVIAQLGSSTWSFTKPADLAEVYSVGEYRLLCNVGSVGQPRDGDRRACYVLFDGSTVVFRRVEYDYQTTIEKIRAGDDDDMHGDRLLRGV